MNATNPIYFVGAGPGDPELLTIKGRRLLDEADVIVYAGSLVNPALLTGLHARLHNSAGLNLDETSALLIEGYQRGNKVVRLHTGDPAIYGAIKEQMLRLDEENIPYAVVPGVTSATASAAALKAELTLPEISQTVIITRQAGRTPVPEKESLQLLASHQATMMIFLSVGMIDTVVSELMAGGYPATTPIAVVEKASWPDERTVSGTLATIARQIKEAGITKTAMIIVGEVLAGQLKSESKLYDKEFSHEFRQGS
ncbi:MAG: precorrin-4 C(11)-methyltransferase [Proteobacteria bacterium]|nr:precorrin-4 C(11)-methyltransferase [Pseudomonadota bacterium]MBU1639149.1 precorrin-4 C(11)-methyltransferase [Pseudomonadota bacterium]